MTVALNSTKSPTVTLLVKLQIGNGVNNFRNISQSNIYIYTHWKDEEEISGLHQRVLNDSNTARNEVASSHQQ